MRPALIVLLVPSLLAAAVFFALYLSPLHDGLAYRDCVGRAIEARAQACDLISVQAIEESCRAVVR